MIHLKLSKSLFVDYLEYNKSQDTVFSYNQFNY